eukprot:jgi/Hompol1/472/HPOL_002503-RA
MLSSVTTNSYRRTALLLVRQFLQDNELPQTLATFELEAAEALESVADMPPVTNRPLVALLEELDALSLQSRMAHLAVHAKLDSELEAPQNDTPPVPSTEPSVYHGIHSANILCIATSSLPSSAFPEHALPDDTVSIILTGSTDKSLKLSDATSGQILASFDHFGSPILSIAVHPLEPAIVVCTNMDGSATLINIGSRTIIASWKDHTKYVTRSAFSPDGQWLVTGSYDRSINVYKRTGGVNPEPVFSKRHAVPFKGAVESLCFVPQSFATPAQQNQSPQSVTADASESIFRVVVGVRDDHNLHYISLDPSETFASMTANMNANGDSWISFVPVYLAPSPSGHHIAVYTDAKAGRIIIYETGTSRIVRDLWGVDADGFSQASCCWHPSGHYLFASSEDRTTVVYHVGSGRIVSKLAGHEGLIRQIAFDPVLNALLTCSYDKTVRVWRFASGSADGITSVDESMA